jgi:hypothetical protein
VLQRRRHQPEEAEEAGAEVAIEEDEEIVDLRGRAGDPGRRRERVSRRGKGEADVTKIVGRPAKKLRAPDREQKPESRFCPASLHFERPDGVRQGPAFDFWFQTSDF